jgi:hypothetical protein
MKLRFRSPFLLLIFALLLTGILPGCAQAGGGLLSGQPKPTPQPAPKAGKSNLTGRLLGQKDGAPLAKVAVRLAQVYRQGGEGAYVLDLARSPGSFTDANGDFLIKDFDPNEYFIVVGEPGDNHYWIVQDSDTKPISYKTEKDKVLDIGTLKVNFVP